MIQQVQLNSISFKSAELSPALKARIEAQNNQQKIVAVDEQPKKKFSITETYNKSKKGVVGFFKGVNNVTGVASGVVRGVAEGAIAAGIIGVVGKNVKNGEGKILETGVGILKDAWSALKVIPKAIKNIFINSPKDNVVKLFKETIPTAIKSVASGLKKHKATALIASGVGLAILVFRAIQGKVKANQNNAELEHKTNLGHV